MRQAELDFVLETMMSAHSNVSDLNMSVGKALQVESSGVLTDVSIKPPIWKLTPYQTETLALNLLKNDPRLTRHLIENGSADTSYSIGDKARFRVNIFSQRNTYSMVLRKLESEIPSIDQLKLPKIFRKISQEKNGLILVTGATGSGKTTSLAAMLDVINKEKAIHVVTLEDPVEYSHKHQKATFNQRELGSDFDTFVNGLRAALRQAPKVILVGEMRDRETVEIGMSAAETGHLVMSTLHTVDAGQTINRLIGMFDLEEENLVRIRLAETLRFVISQRLLPRKGGGRVAAFEIMGNNLRIKDAILNGEQEGKSFYEIISDSFPFGWRTFDKSILDLYSEGMITEDTALAYASRKPIVGRGIDQIKSGRGEKTTDIDDLSMDQDAEKSLSGFKRRRR